MTSVVSAEEVFRQLADSLALNGSPEFFHELVRRLTTILGVDHALVAEVVPGTSVARTLAIWSEGKSVDNFDYSLAGTPCETVIGAHACFYPCGVCARFPEDASLWQMGVEGYYGFPLVTQDGVPVGLLAVLTNQPLVLPSFAEEVMRISAAQAGAELGRRRVEESLRESERRLHTLMNHLPGMAYRCRNDARWTMEFVSQGATALTGYSPEALVHNREVAYGHLIHPLDRSRVDAEVQAGLAANKLYRCTYRLINAQNETRWVWEQGQGVISPDGGEVLLEGFVSDVTEQHDSERVQEAVVQTAMAVTNRAGTDFFRHLVLHLTRALEADVGFIATFCDDQTMETQARVVSGETVENLQYRIPGTPCEAVVAQGEHVGCYDPPFELSQPDGKEPLKLHSYVGRRLDTSSGEPIGTLMVLYSKPLPDLNLATSVIRILAAGAAGELERQTNDRRIYQIAYMDSTTELPNRIHFMERLVSELRRAEQAGKSLGLVLLDLKRFKEINDVLGHDTGDLLLSAVARRLAQQVCSPGEFLARLSGDEFALLVPQLSGEGLSGAIERCQHSMALPVAAAGREFTLDVNIGAACYPSDALTSGELFQCASVAMHEAKRKDWGACIYDVSMAEALNRRRALAERFSRALTNQELSLRYQPLVDLGNGALVGAEVLCRWYDEHWGWVSPAEFIPLAEERGLIQPLGEWILQTASQQLAHWRQRDLHFSGRLSVNISALQFSSATLAEEIGQLTAQVEPEAIGLELTESGFMRDPELAVEITERLREAGFGLSIDDFGTGYSSLSYLRRFAADTLKIDMSFVSDMLENASDYTIVTTIVAMAHSLGMTAVAEGVETQAQADALTRLGCDKAQGFLYDRPLTSEQFAERWLLPSSP